MSIFSWIFQVEEHFGICHIGENLDMKNAINKCQTCFEGPFPSFPELLKHLAFFHPEILDFGKDDEEDAEVLNPLHPIQDRPKGKATAGQTVKNTSLVVLRQNRGYYPQAEHRDLREYLNSKKRNSKWNLPERKHPEIVTIGN